MATDLPEPVVPAMSRCGMRARSTSTGSPPIALPRQSGSRDAGLGVIARREQLAQIDFLAGRIGQFDADGVAARHHGDARRERAHRAGDVVGEADHARRFDAGRRLEFVERDHRPGPRIDDLAAHAEIAEHAFERRGVFLQGFAADGGAADLLGASAVRAAADRSRRDRRGFGARGLRGARGSASGTSSLRHPRHTARARARRCRSAARCAGAARAVAARGRQRRGAPAEQPRKPRAQAQQRVHRSSRAKSSAAIVVVGRRLDLVFVVRRRPRRPARRARSCRRRRQR